MLRLMWRQVVVVVALAAGTAQAGPTARFGVTYAAEDPQASSVELGPMIAVGDRIGPLVAELEWANLSFLDPHSADDGGVNRLGLTLRADLLSSRGYTCFHRYACTYGRSVYGELGAAERFGQWYEGAYAVTPAHSPQPEVHVGLGLELDNQIAPHRYGWQLGMRVALAPADPILATTCRGSCPASATASSGGTDVAVLVEWMFLIGN